VTGPPAGIGLSGQMHGLVALDAGLRPVRPAILWNDQRTGPQCAEIERRVGRERLIALTGNRALTGFTAPKLLWMRKHEPGAYARIAIELAGSGFGTAVKITAQHARRDPGEAIAALEGLLDELGSPERRPFAGA
jgi:xylulokinase